MERQDRYGRVVLRPQDILVLLKLVAWDRIWTFDQIAHELGLSASAVHRSVDRAAAAGLYRPSAKEVNRPALIEFLAGSTTLSPGTVILTGTPHGVGVARTPPVWLKAGDEVSIVIERIGTLTNPVEEESSS